VTDNNPPDFVKSVVASGMVVVTSDSGVYTLLTVFPPQYIEAGFHSVAKTIFYLLSIVNADKVFFIGLIFLWNIGNNQVWVGMRFL
jgi:hypothetical protein